MLIFCSLYIDILFFWVEKRGFLILNVTGYFIWWLGNQRIFELWTFVLIFRYLSIFKYREARFIRLSYSLKFFYIILPFWLSFWIFYGLENSSFYLNKLAIDFFLGVCASSLHCSITPAPWITIVQLSLPLCTST